MALLGNVQCNGYVPGYHSTRSRDLIYGAEGSTWTTSNGNIELQNDRYTNGSLSVPSSVQLLNYDKELLKQTILKQEAIFRDQIQEMHRLYCRQRELMDEVKRNELDKNNLRLETARSSSFLSRASSKNAERVCPSPNLAWSTSQSSAILAESIQLPLGSGQENGRQVYCDPAHASTLTEGFLKDYTSSESKYKKFGNKLLDLHLPADEYIDTEGDPLEDDRTLKLPKVSGYTLKGISQAVCNSGKKQYIANPNGFTDLNEPFKLNEEAAARSDDLMGPNSHGKKSFHDLFARKEPDSHYFPNDVIWNPYKRQDPEVCSNNLPSKQEKKHELLSFMSSSGPFNQGTWSGRKFSTGESFAGTQGLTGAGLLGPSSDPYRLAFGQSSKLMMGMPGRAGDEFFRCRNITYGPNLDSHNFILNSLRGSNTLDPQSVTTDDLNNFGNRSSSTSHELMKYIKASEDVGTFHNINLNVMPANFSDTAASQSIKEDLLPKGKPSEENKIPTQVESFLIKTTEASDLSRKIIHPFNINGEPDNSELHSSHASLSKVCQNLTKMPMIEQIEKGCVSDVNLPCNYVPDLGVPVTAGDNLTKNEQESERRSVAGIIDLNLCMNEDENMPMDTELQAPVSPENKESSPPRGESDENQLETPYRLAGQEHSVLQVEEVKIAAEALVSISAYVGHNGLQVITNPPSESCLSSPLHWFARIASVIDDPEHDTKLDFICNTDDFEEFLPASIDYFEAMTLKLTETKILDCCGKSSGQKDEEGGSTSPNQPRKGWTNKGRRRKDFQSEILLGLASLSRYEVTEDLQTIGGLMEAAGTHSGRNALARGRRRSCTSASNNTDLMMKKQQQLTSIAELGIEKRGLKSWGKKNKKLRGKRYPARNPQGFFLSQVYN
ncbi:uncharacterized protein G2W53_038389 [Senna tora]|uniref:Uncharacterized protein n=1 Tax=Senna tora TaxID=362788 RepID=A0A834SL10_9FABA|nr:uncharacterized protein G2W53_038389 [Senna tora]